MAGGRIVDQEWRLRKIAAAQRRGRSEGVIVIRRTRVRAFPSDEKEGAVFTVIEFGDHHGSAGGYSELVEAEWTTEVIAARDGLFGAAVGEEVGRIELFVAEEFVGAAVERISAGFGDHVQHAAAGA